MSRLYRVGSQAWPWAVLALVSFAAWATFVSFESELDGEHPSVLRPTFSARPPATYRLAEPGDTLDKFCLYLGAAGIALASLGAWRGRGSKTSWFWLGALGPLLVVGWNAATPWPSFDGWHGLNWRVVNDGGAPAGLRIGLAIALGVLIFWTLYWWGARRAPGGLHALGIGRSDGALLGVAALFGVVSILGLGDVEPRGYWPRCGLVLGLLAFDLVLFRLSWFQFRQGLPRVRFLRGLAWSLAVWCVVSAAGRWMIWYHRPLERLRAVVPGKIYISAMPTYAGLEVAQRRLGFKTIVNLFHESGDQRSPLLPEELRFARERNVRYYGCPGSEQAEAFFNETLALAQDPEAWPILVHCHGCMDRSPAWMGLYRFLVEGEPLAEIMKEIEGHRGSRPKAHVSLLYDHILRRIDPERYLRDPTRPILEGMVKSLPDRTWLDELPELRGEDVSRVSRRMDETARP